jgi:hypothetical protein
MFIQGSNAELDISVSLPEDQVNVIPLEDATVTVYFQRRDYKFNKEVVVTDVDNGKAICYLKAEELIYDGNYDYQVVLKYSNGNTIKSCINTLFVYPALDVVEPILPSSDTTGVDING